MMRILANDVHYHVEVLGKGEPLLFLHGFTGDTSTWEEITQQLTEHYQCILIDIIGHGKTESPERYERYMIEQVADDIKNILDQLNISKVSIIGYSMGGRLGLTFALLYPELIHRLILESSTPGLANEEKRKERREADSKLADSIEKNGVEAFINYWENISLFSTQKKLPLEKRRAIRQQRLSQNPTGLSNSLRGMGTGSQPSWWHRIGDISFPFMMIVGGKDIKFCQIADSMKELNQNLVIKTIDSAGHANHVEEPRKFGKIIREFLLIT